MTNVDPCAADVRVGAVGCQTGRFSVLGRIMSESSTIIARIGRWLGLRRHEAGALPLEREVPADPAGEVAPRPPRRLGLWRPWARREAVISGLQQAFASIAELTQTIRDNLERQGRRQEELLVGLSRLVEVVQTLPEAQRLHGEALRAIGEQLRAQMQREETLAEILQRVGDAHAGQREALEAVRSQVQAMGTQTEAIAGNLGQLGSAIETLGRASESSSALMQQLTDSIAARNGEMQRALERQSARLTLMLIVASVASAAAVAAAGVVGLLLLRK